MAGFGGSAGAIAGYSAKNNPHDVYGGSGGNSGGCSLIYETLTVLKHTKSDALSGMIYILRWDNLEGLNNAFDGVDHHIDRLNNKKPLSTLDNFLKPIGITKEKFINLLEL